MKIKDNFLLVEKIEKEEKVTASGLIISHAMFDDFDFTQVHVKKAKVKIVPESETFYKVGDVVILKSYSGVQLDEGMLVPKGLVMGTCNENESITPEPDSVIIKIRKEDRDALFAKTITRDDGTKVKLFIAQPVSADDVTANEKFVSCGEIVSRGTNVKLFECGDLAILDYTLDNDESVIVGYEGDDKLVAVKAHTTFVDRDLVVYAHREPQKTQGNAKAMRVSRDQIVQHKGDYNEMSLVLGVIRGEKLIANEPFVFLDYEDTKIMKVAAGGLIYEEDRKYLNKSILGLSPESAEKYGLDTSKKYLVDDFDIFIVTLLDGSRMYCINDRDIIAEVNE
jgi:co-chaperonin GroES (HSP10)